MLSNYLAELWGISIVIISLVMLVKDKHIKKIFASIETEENFFFWGMLSSVVGVATILAHNIWVSDWPVVITIFGWVALIKGLALLLIPEQVKMWSKKIENWPYLQYAMIVTLLIGLVLTYLGFRG